MTKQTMTAEEFDEYFDNGGDCSPFIVEGSITQPNKSVRARKINISMPEWMIDDLDRVANRLAVSRQAVINMWIADRLRQEGISQ